MGKGEGKRGFFFGGGAGGDWAKHMRASSSDSSESFLKGKIGYSGERGGLGGGEMRKCLRCRAIEKKNKEERKR